MPAPGRRARESELAKKNLNLLKHASPTEYDVIVAEHEFHEMRLAAIAAGRSASKATTQGPSRTVSKATTAGRSSYTQQMERRDVAKRQDAHVAALDAIKHRDSAHPTLPYIRAPGSEQHRTEIARGIDTENTAMAARLYHTHSSIPSVAQCRASERERAKVRDRLRTVKDTAPQTPREELPAIHAEREQNFVVDAIVAATTPRPPAMTLPAITDRHGRPVASTQPHTARSAAPARTPAETPRSSNTARATLKMPPKPPRLPVPPKKDPGTLRTRVPFSVALQRNPALKYDPEAVAAAEAAQMDEHGARQRYFNADDLERDEAAAREHIADDEGAAREPMLAPAAAEAAKAEERAKEREAFEAEQQAERDDEEADEADARDAIVAEEKTARDGVTAAAAKDHKAAEEHERQRIERDKQKVRRRFEAAEADETRQRDEVESEEDRERAGIRKQWRKLLLEAEESNALAHRADARRLVTGGQLDGDGTSHEFEIVVAPKAYDAAKPRGSWAACDRVYLDSSSGSIRVTRGQRLRGTLPEALRSGNGTPPPEAEGAGEDGTTQQSRRGSTASNATAASQAISPEPAADAAEAEAAHDDVAPGDPAHVFQLVALHDGYVAIAHDDARPGSPEAGATARMLLITEGPNEPLVLARVVLDDTSAAAHGPHAFQIEPLDDEAPTGDRAVASFHLVPRDHPELVITVKAVKDGAPALVLAKAGPSAFALLSAADCDEDDRIDAEERRAAREAAKEEAERAANERRRAVAKELVPGGLEAHAWLEIALASDLAVRVVRSSADDRAKLRAVERTGSELDRFAPVLLDTGHIVLSVSDDDTSLVSVPPSTKGGALRAEVAAGKEKYTRFELLQAEEGEEASELCGPRFLLQPQAHPGFVVDVQLSSEQRKLVLCPLDSVNRDTAEFVFQDADQVAAMDAEADTAAAEAEAAANAKREKKRQAQEQKRIEAAKAAVGTANALEEHEVMEIYLVVDSAQRVVRTASETGAPLGIDERTRSTRDQFVPLLCEGGYVMLATDGGAGNEAVCVPESADDANAVLTVETVTDATRERALFEVLHIAPEEGGLEASSSSAVNRFVLRPKAHPKHVVEADLDSDAHRLVLVAAGDASNFGELVFIPHATAEAVQRAMDEEKEAERRAQLEEEAAADRLAALTELVGDPELMTVYEIMPVDAPEKRLIARDGDAIGGPIVVADKAGASEKQQFVFTDIGDGYVNLIPWVSAECVVEMRRDDDDLPYRLTVQKGVAPSPSSFASTTTVGGGQLFEVVLKGDLHFSLVPRDEPNMVVSVSASGELEVVPVESATSASEFKLALRDASGSDSAGSGLVSPTGEAEVRRREALEAIVGDLDALEVWELVPAEVPRMRLRYRPAEAEDDDDADGGGGTASGVIVRSRKGKPEEQFMFVDAGDGYVHIVPCAEPELALAVDFNDTNRVIFAEKEDGSVWQCFELTPCEMSPRKGSARKPFLVVPRAVRGVVLDLTDDDRAPMALMPDTELSPMSELVIMTQEESEEEHNRRQLQRQQSKMDAEAKARKQACAEIFGEKFGLSGTELAEARFEGGLAPGDDMERRLGSVAVDGASVARIFLPVLDGERVVPEPQCSLTVQAAGGGYVTLAFADPSDAAKRLYLTVDGPEATPALRALDDARTEDAAKFEVVLLETEGSFCFAPKLASEHVVESVLNEDGQLVLVSADEASSFGELRLADNNGPRSPRKAGGPSQPAEPAPQTIEGVETIEDGDDEEEPEDGAEDGAA